MASTVDKFQAIWLKILSSSNVLVQSLVFFCVSSSFIFLWRLFQSVLINDYITSNFQDLHMTYLASSNWSQWLLTGSNFLYIFITKTRTKSKKDFWTEEQQFVWNFIQSFFSFYCEQEFNFHCRAASLGLLLDEDERAFVMYIINKIRL